MLIAMVYMLILGCSRKEFVEIHNKLPESNTARKLALFLDGTGNDRNSRTNISRLYEITSNQDRDNMYLFYSEGVGSNANIFGAGAGSGIGKDVIDSYYFLEKYYKKNEDSEIYIFGFSRGAYTARILAGMLYTIGLYNLSAFSDEDKKEIIYDLYYSAYKGKDKKPEKIKEDARKIIDIWREKRLVKQYVQTVDSSSCDYYKENQIKIKFMGLWDTVEALGLTSSWEAFLDKSSIKNDSQEIKNPNKRYFDQICNIEHVSHALSLDDNRAFVFTPIIMTYGDINKACKANEGNISQKVNEVWFSGAHSNVGGGYGEDTSLYDKKSTINLALSGVSLNWMISEIQQYGDLLPKHARVFEDRFAYIHNAEDGIEKIYRNATRLEIVKKYINTDSVYKELKVHKSFFDRVEANISDAGYDSKWYKSDFFEKCFKQNSDEQNCTLINKIPKDQAK